MIIDTHAHALDAAFLDELCKKPQFGLAAERRSDGRYWLKRGDGPFHSLDENLTDVEKRVASLARRNVELQLIGPPPGFVAWPSGAAGVDYARKIDRKSTRLNSSHT